MLRWLRRVLAFAFSHDWRVAGAWLEGEDMRTMLRCQQCGRTAEYRTLRFLEYARLYRMKGCRGNVAQERV